jgi:hypothetical protein
MTPKRAIGGKALNSGIRGGLWDAKHYDRMGDAVWLFGWLVHRQTTQTNGTGLVLRGLPLTYAEISADTGWQERTLQRWMARLRRAGYIEVKHSIYSRMVIRILNAKKFSPKQFDLALSSPPDVAEISPPTVMEMGTKSGGLKEGTEIEQKLPWNKNNAAQPVAGFSGQPLPDWIPIRTWAAFVEMRREIGRHLTEHAVDLVFRKLATLKAAGNDPAEVLEQSILNSWTGLYPIKENDHGSSNGNRKASGAVAPTAGKYDHRKPDAEFRN